MSLAFKLKVKNFGHPNMRHAIEIVRPLKWRQAILQEAISVLLNNLLMPVHAADMNGILEKQTGVAVQLIEQMCATHRSGGPGDGISLQIQCQFIRGDLGIKAAPRIRQRSVQVTARAHRSERTAM